MTASARIATPHGPICRAAWCFVALLLLLLSAPLRAAPLLLDEGAGSHDAWDAARLVFDPESALSPEAALRRLQNAPPPAGPRANLGKRRGAAWIAVPVQTAAGGHGRWVLEADYASLDQVDLWVLDGPRVERRVRMGDHVPAAERPLRGRTHTVFLDLPPGTSRLLLLRVQTEGSMIVPLTLYTPEAYAVSEARQQALQALLAGAGLCMLAYSLAQWAMLRQPLFGLYALTLAGTNAFFAALSGVGPQHLWGGIDWLVMNGPPFFILLGVSGAFGFVRHALEVPRGHPRVDKLLLVCSLLSGSAALLLLAGVLDYPTAQAVGMALGPMPLLLVLPIAWRRLRRGDAAASLVLAGWGVYSVGVVAIVGMLSGRLAVGFWTLHAFQLASLFEMAMWMLVLGVRVRDLQRGATVLRTERDLMRSMALTDVLTGLLNRRGLHEALAPRLAAVDASRPTALFLTDLDGFKAVNDTLGHEAGDVLLQAVASRLRQNLRPDDLVARLGGDEFVIAAAGLRDAADAEIIGDKLLAAFRAPFNVQGRDCRVGLTIGYAVAPVDGRDVALLLKRADAAMYLGKQAGKHCMKRALAA